MGVGGAEGQSRTGDTAIFSRVLYHLSYLGPKSIVASHHRAREHARARARVRTVPGRAAQVPLGCNPRPENYACPDLLVTSRLRAAEYARVRTRSR